LLSFSCFASAAEKSVHWSDLDSLIAGREVVVQLQDGKRVKGSTVRVGADSMIIETSAGQRSIPRLIIREIRLSRRAGYKWRIIGAAIGAGVGTAAAVPILSETHNEGSSRFDGLAAGVIVGLATLGYLCGWSVDRSGDVLHVLPD
jgi:hypothetical protein